MAGIYIPGMEMPTNCEKCPLLDYEEGFCLASGVKGKSGWYESVLCPGSIKDGRHEDCPLIEVPDHYDLIDHNKLKIAVMDCDVDSKIDFLKHVMDCINNAPVIIPGQIKRENDEIKMLFV